MANEVNSAAQTFRVDTDSALDASGGSNIFRMEPAGGAKSTDAAPAAAPDGEDSSLHSSLLGTLGEDDPTGEGGRAPTAAELAALDGRASAGSARRASPRRPRPRRGRRASAPRSRRPSACGGPRRGTMRPGSGSTSRARSGGGRTGNRRNGREALPRPPRITRVHRTHRSGNRKNPNPTPLKISASGAAAVREAAPPHPQRSKQEPKHDLTVILHTQQKQTTTQH